MRCATLILGDVRTAEDDIEFAVRQLVEVALRALSPAINDPFTAMAAIDWLAAGLGRLGREEFPTRHRYRDGRLRVVADISTLGGMIHTVFSGIRHAGGASPVVLNRLLEAVAVFGPDCRDPEDRAVIHAEIEAVLAQAARLGLAQPDRDDLERRHERALSALGG